MHKPSSALATWSLCCCLVAVSSAHQLGQYFQQQHQQQQQQQALQLLSGPNAYAPTIIPFSFNQNVQENQRAIVMCTTSSGEIPLNFTWSKDGQLLTAPFAQLKRIQIKNDQDSSTLKISTVRLDHAGNYTCLARNRHGSQSYQAQLVVHGEPRWLREPPHEPLVATRGQTVVIDCLTAGWPRPQQSWQVKTHTQGEFEPLTFGGRISLAPNGSLVIRQADKADEANYLCKSSNGIGRGLSWSTSLKVTVAAHFDAAHRHQAASVVRRGGQVQLRCDAYGDPPIAVEWYKGKELLSAHDLQDTRYSMHSNNNPLKSGVISQLLIKQAQRADNGVFECVTRNAHGRDRQQIELVVQEEPDNIGDLQLTQFSSRSVTLAWSDPYDGRSPISEYTLQYRRADSGAPYDAYLAGDEQQQRLTKPSGDSGTATDWQHAHRLSVALAHQPPGPANASLVRTVTIDKLEPASKYIVRALAANAVGQSKFSEPMEFSTDEEAPSVGPVNIGAVALNSSAIQVSWDEIAKSKQLGRIHGYYIGYREASNNSAATNFIYKPFIVGEQALANGAGRLDTVLSELRRDTVYEITVVAFNSRGSGPSVDFVVCKTVEMEAPRPVKLQVRRESNDSIVLEWQRDTSDQNPVDIYDLYQEKNWNSKEWVQVKLPGNQTQFRAAGLKCGTRYQFYIIAHNKVGKSQPSEVVSASTSGSLPAVPGKSALITKLNSTCLLINLNSFQDTSCRIKAFTVRYRVEKGAGAQAGGAQLGGAALSAGAAGQQQQQQQAGAGDGPLIGPNGMSAARAALTGVGVPGAGPTGPSTPSAQAPGAPAGPAAQAALLLAGSASAAGLGAAHAGPAGAGQPHAASEWTSIRPRSGQQQHLFGYAHGLANDEERMEYLCELAPTGEYTIHVAASNDVGRSEVEYTVLMSSDELRHSAWRDALQLLASMPNVFAYIPSIIVFLLAGLLLGLVCLILYTTAIKYYQKFVIMQNQMRATRRAKADEKRRRKLANGRNSAACPSAAHNSAKLELWADEYEDELDEPDEDADDERAHADADDDDHDHDHERHQIMGRQIMAGSMAPGADDDANSDELNSSFSASTSGACSSASSSLAARRAMLHYQQHSSASAKQHQQQRAQQCAKRRRQRHSMHHAQHPAGHYYLSNIANSAFDTSSIDTASGGRYAPAKCAGSTCMSTASTDSIQGRFQCLNSKQYVKMNEYTMLPSISANLAANDIYGSAPAHGLNRSPLRAGAPAGAHAPTNSASSSASPSSQLTTNGSLYYSTLRRVTNMQTYLPQQQRAPTSAHRQARPSGNNGADIYGYYMAPPQQQQQQQHTMQATVAAAAAQQAANEVAHSIFVPPQQQRQHQQQAQQIIYSAPNIRRQIHQQSSPQVFL